MTPITAIGEMAERAKVEAITFGRWLNLVVWAVVLTSMAVFHIYLKLSASDYTRSTGRIQKRCEALENKASELKIKVAELDSIRHAQAKAKELGMAVADLSQMVTLNEKAKRQLDEWNALYQSRQAPGGERRSLDPSLDNTNDKLKPGVLERVMACIAGRGGEKRGQP